MRLILMRHAEAGDPDPARHPDDRQRPLTADGRREHAAVAGVLARMGVAPTRVLTSPLVRARETAEITARVLGWAGAAEPLEALGDAFSAAGVLAALDGARDGDVVLCVGHEPSLSRFASSLLSGEGILRMAMPKSGVLGLEFGGRPRPGRGVLLFLLPREIYRAHDGAG
jgi:phosphohistidine phosphatase